MAANQFAIPDAYEVREIMKSIAPSWRFISIMPEIDTQVSSTRSFSETGGGMGGSYSSTPRLSGSQVPIGRCAECDIPPMTIDTDERFGGGKNIYAARTISSSPVTLSFYESEDYSVSKYIWAWHRKIITENNLYELPIVYKKELSVWAFGDRSNTKPGMIVTFVDCFPTVTPSGLTYSQSDSGFLTVSAEFSVDKMKLEFPG